MWPFKQNIKRSLESEIASYQEQEQINQLKARVAKQRLNTTLPGEARPVAMQESVLGLLNNGISIGVSSLLDPYRELLAIPGMIRERMVYKSAVVRTIQQQDFVRFVSNALYEESTHFRTAVKVMSAAIFGLDGLTIQIVAKKGKDVSEPKLEDLDDIITEICEENKIKDVMIKEAHKRYEIQGEVFIRIIKDKRDLPKERTKPTRLVIIDPAFIRPSEKNGANFEDPAVSGGLPSKQMTDWSFGIKNKSLDYTKPEAYQIVWPDTTEEVVPADEMIHIKNVPFDNIKRGVSSAFAISDELIGATVLRAALREGAKVRAVICGVVQHAQASEDDMSNMVDQLGLQNGTTQTGRVDANGMPYSIQAINTEIGGILHIGKEAEFVNGPKLPDGAEMKMVYDMTINTISAHWQVPPPALSGEAAGSAYASSLVEESSYTRAREEEQAIHCRLWKDVFKKVLPHELSRRGINPAVLDKTEIQVTGPSLVVRNKLDEAKEHQVKLANKIESREDWQIQQGLDPKETDEKIKMDDMHPDEDVEMDADGKSIDGSPKTMGGQRQKDEK